MFVTLVSCILALQPDPVPTAIRDARLILDSQTTIEKGTIVLRGGFIEALGADVTPPPDAELIDGSGLTVCPAFVDAFAQLGLGDAKWSADRRKLAEGEAVDFARDALAGMESANRKGVRPELDAADYLALGESELKRWHEGGFALAALAVREEYWSGRAARVVLSGVARRSAMLRRPAHMHASFESYGEGYPQSAMGVMAHLRQTLLDAQHYRRLHEHFERSGQGPRPPIDPALEALVPVAEGRAIVFFEASSAIDIDRALALSEQFGFPLVIVGGAEAWKRVDRLKARDVPVVLSLKWPREPKETQRRDPDAIEEFKPPKLRAHDKDEWERTVRCAIRLHEAGVSFALSSHAIQPREVLEKAAQLIERGLPEGAALRALTATPARILGLDALAGTLAPGRPAHVTVLSSALADKRTKVKYVFADGLKSELDARKRADRPSITIQGTWDVRSPALTGTLDLRQSRADLTGTFKTEALEVEVAGRVTGSEFELSATVNGVRYEVRGVLVDDRLEGTISAPGQPDADWTATKPE